MSVKVAFYKGRDTFLDRLVQWWTNSTYSHCEIVIGDMAYSSSPRDGGVRAKKIAFTPEHWDFVVVPDANVGQVLQWFEQHAGAKYDWLGLLGFVIPHRFNWPDRWFCSEACAEALGFTKSWELAPCDLFHLLADKGGPLNAQPIAV